MYSEYLKSKLRHNCVFELYKTRVYMNLPYLTNVTLLEHGELFLGGCSKESLGT